MKQRTVALISARGLDHLDEDLPLLHAALSDRGVLSTTVDWHDSDFDWTVTDLAIIRSTWDYTTHFEEFLEWTRCVSKQTQLMNPAGVIHWNAHKHYLLDLESSGVGIVPTLMLEPFPAPTRHTVTELIASLTEKNDVDAVVVKPAISAGGRDTERHSLTSIESLISHVEAILSSGRPVMIQPYMKRIESEDETGLVFIGGVYSHAFKKGAMLHVPSRYVEGHYRKERISPYQPSERELKFARDVIELLPSLLPDIDQSQLLYARIDLIPGEDGTPLLLELELTEPSLFCAIHPESAERFADVVVAMLQI